MPTSYLVLLIQFVIKIRVLANHDIGQTENVLVLKKKDEKIMKKTVILLDLTLKKYINIKISKKAIVYYCLSC